MSVLNQTISDTNFPDDEVSFVINKWKNQFPAVEKISVSLQRSQDKISGKHVHDCIGEAEAAKTISSTFDYNALYEDTSYIYYSILQPLQKNFTNLNDRTQVKMLVKEDGSLEKEVKAELVIVIPNKKEWVSYIAMKYRKLTKFAPFIKGMHFEVQKHKIRKIKIMFNFEYDFNMIKYLKEAVINEQFFNNWIATCHIIENYTKEHTSNIDVAIKENNMRIHYQSIKVKFSRSIEL